MSAWQNAEVWAGNNDRYDSMIDKPRRNNEFYMRGWNSRDVVDLEVKELCAEIKNKK